MQTGVARWTWMSEAASASGLFAQRCIW